MPPTLSQNEVDALMDALHEGQVDETDGEGGASISEEDVKPLDLTSRDRIVRGRMPTLDVIHARLAQRVGNRLAAMLRSDVELVAEPAQPLKLGEYLSYQPAPACIHLFSLSPLQGTGLFSIQPDLFFLVLDSVFGGHLATDSEHSAHVGGRELTSIEMDFAADLVGGMCADMRSAWTDVRDLDPAYLGTESVPEHVAIGTPSDVMMTSTFRLTFGTQEYQLDVALPYSALEPIKPRLVEQHMEETAADRERWQARLRKRLGSVPLHLQLELGRTRLSLADLMRLGPGDVIRLDRPPDSELPLRAAGRLLSMVTPLQVDGNLGFEFQDWRSDER